MAVPALQSAAAVLHSPAPLTAQRLVQLQAVARLQEGASSRSEGAAGSAEPIAAIELLPCAPPETVAAPASNSQRALGVGETSQVASLKIPPSFSSVSGTFVLCLPLSPMSSGS